jgi:hypothetical protein
MRWKAKTYKRCQVAGPGKHREPSPPPSAQPILVTTRPRSLLPVAEIAHRLTAALADRYRSPDLAR